MALTAKGFTTGSKTFDPDAFFDRWAKGTITAPQSANLRSAIITAFDLRLGDDYIYHALASVSLAQVQQVIDKGAAGGLHNWYPDKANSTQLDPSAADIDAYCSIFASTTSTAKALTALEKNAKKATVRASVAAHLVKNRAFPTQSAFLTIPKLKKPHINPYLDYWTWSCHNLEWAGPNADTVKVHQSHHILPVFYHHFGCVCPTFESLETIRQLARDRPVIEVGSGNGYWAFLLRRLGITVHAIDNGDSLWRTMWIGDTIKADAAQYLETFQARGIQDAVLLMVYPQVSTHFTTSVLNTFKGDTICVAGTQNKNGYTAFRDVVIDEYMAANKPEYQKIIQTPLPSFAGKDEAFFVFKRT